MKRVLPIALLLFAFAVPGWVAAQPGGYPPPRWAAPAPNLTGTWYMHGDERLPTYIEQRNGRGDALFTNEHGDSAWGTIQGDRVWIPDWSDGRRRGLVGVIEGQRIVWPNGTYWSLRPERGFRFP
jgi:hypothetical protein